MKVLAIILLVFSVVGWAGAQSAGLRFDPKWRAPKFEAHEFSPSKKLVLAPDAHQRPIPQAWCYSDLAFFCKMEVKMERAARFPIKFRLGDVNYVDQMEGKRPSY